MKWRIDAKQGAIVAGIICVISIVILLISTRTYLVQEIGKIYVAVLHYTAADLPAGVELSRLLITTRATEEQIGGSTKTCGSQVFQLKSSMLKKLGSSGLDALSNAWRSRGHDSFEPINYDQWQATPINDDLFVPDELLSAISCGLPSRYRSAADNLIYNEGGFYTVARTKERNVLLLLALQAGFAYLSHSKKD